jgi:hypothetical protein
MLLVPQEIARRDFVPDSSRLGLFIPRFFHLSSFLSSEFIIIGAVLTPSQDFCGCPPTRLLAQVRWHTQRFWVLLRTSRRTEPHSSLQDDDDLTTMSPAALFRLSSGRSRD